VNFHIGLEKTGTTSFQWFCTEQREVLSRHSLLYPTENQGFDRFCHQHLVDCYLDERQLGHPPARLRPEVLASLRTEMVSSPAERILIAGEFSSMFDDGQIERLADDFAGFDCRISVTVREHHSRLVSAYCNAVVYGQWRTLDQYCDLLLRPGNRYLRYADTIAGWDRVFGRDNVRVFCLPSSADVVPILADALIAPGVAMPGIASRRRNVSAEHRATEYLRRVNAGLVRLPGFSRPAVRRSLIGPRRMAARLLTGLGSADDSRRLTLGDANARRLQEISAFDAAWLKERYGVDLAITSS
jgi:hypothetical protein